MIIGTPWSDAEIEWLKSRLELDPTARALDYSQIKTFNPRTKGAIDRKAQRLESLKEVVTAIEHDDEIEPKSGNEFTSFIDGLHEAVKSIKPIEPIVIKRGSSFVVLLSDTHIGKLTKHFNAEVFTERILSIPNKILQDLTLDLSDLTEIVLILGGDMLEGENIYPTQASHLEMTAIDQVKGAVDALWSLAILMEKTFSVPVRFVTCPGNHGRVSKQNAEKSNWDNVIYQTLEYIISASGTKNISIECNMDSFYTFKVQDKTGMVFHHGTKHLGTASMQVKTAGWIYTKDFDFMVHGHWHEWAVNSQFGKLVMKNGSLCGEDDLSERMGVYNPPRQGWMVITAGQPIGQMGFFEWDQEFA